MVAGERAGLIALPLPVEYVSRSDQTASGTVRWRRPHTTAVLWSNRGGEPCMNDKADRAGTPSPATVTESGFPFDPSYAPDDLAGWDPAMKLGEPGRYPYTRGVYPTM